ncbi:hypothetical protein PILCRDRAFT_826238 [Piloderma croceum F 1598]|uniref:Uncharacterized protein n=1 Tax=Piloderma croceum (strain F 1598) TaxID=765440 RepID=A0A0C3BGI7_PILCF|nr:hypothetical protein PILCRDRAFT_826238 [Piloderma croceum F 1598]
MSGYIHKSIHISSNLRSNPLDGNINRFHHAHTRVQSFLHGYYSRNRNAQSTT